MPQPFELTQNEAKKVACNAPLLAFSQIINKKLSGTLQTQKGKIVRRFKWSNGECFDVLSNAKSELAGTFLLKKNLISQDQFKTYAGKLKTKGNKTHWNLLEEIASLSANASSDLQKEFVQHIIFVASKEIDSAIVFQPKSLSFNLPFHTDGFEILTKAAKELSQEEILAMCPNLSKYSSIYTTELYKNLPETIQLDAEQKGLMTVIKNNAQIEEVFASSFLEEEQIYKMMLSFWLLGLVEVKSQEDTQRDTLLESLPKQDRDLREKILNQVKSFEQSSYYDWLDLDPSTPPSDINKITQAQIVKFAAPSVEKLFLPSEKQHYTLFLEKLKEARSVILNPSLRLQYNEFLEKGQRGSFQPSKDSASTTTTDEKKVDLMDVIHKGFQANKTVEPAKFAQILKSLNFYQLLRVQPDAKFDQIRSAYRKCSMKMHPDRFFQSSPGVKEQSKQLYKKMVSAYSTLKDAEKRRAYDQKLFS